MKDKVLVMKPTVTAGDISMHCITWLMVVLMTVAGIVDNFFYSSLIFSVPLMSWSLLYAFCQSTRVIMANDKAIESHCFGICIQVYRWEEIKAYRLRHQAGDWFIDSKPFSRSSVPWQEESYTLTLYPYKGLPIKLSNHFNNYKKFKNLVKDQNIHQRPTVKKR